MEGMRIANHVVDLVGNTPLVKLNSVVTPGSGLVTTTLRTPVSESTLRARSS